MPPPRDDEVQGHVGGVRAVHGVGDVDAQHEGLAGGFAGGDELEVEGLSLDGGVLDEGDPVRVPVEALDAVWTLVELANKYVVEQAPWRLAKQRADPSIAPRLAACLYNLAESLRITAHYLQAFLPSTAREILRQLGLPDGATDTWATATSWARLPSGTATRDGPPLFTKR